MNDEFTLAKWAKKSPTFTFILGIVQVGALIGLYSALWGPKFLKGAPFLLFYCAFIFSAALMVGMLCFEFVAFAVEFKGARFRQPHFSAFIFGVGIEAVTLWVYFTVH